jgi:hypothetical protein
MVSDCGGAARNQLYVQAVRDLRDLLGAEPYHAWVYQYVNDEAFRRYVQRALKTRALYTGGA